MRPARFAVIGLLLVVLGAASAPPELVTSAAWARATPPGARAAAGYLTIENRGGRTDRLLSVTTDAAKRAELHVTSMQNGVMKMRPAPDGLPIGAGGVLALEPRGAHIMLIEPKAPLVQGGTVAVDLHFEHSDVIRVQLAVLGLDALSYPQPAPGAAR